MSQKIRAQTGILYYKCCLSFDFLNGWRCLNSHQIPTHLNNYGKFGTNVLDCTLHNRHQMVTGKLTPFKLHFSTLTYNMFSQLASHPLNHSLIELHQNTKRGNIVWKNGVQPSSRAPETWRLLRKMCWLFLSFVTNLYILGDTFCMPCCKCICKSHFDSFRQCSSNLTQYWSLSCSYLVVTYNVTLTTNK